MRGLKPGLHWEREENIPKKLGTAPTIEPAAALQELAEPWSRGDRVKAAIAQAARRAGLRYWRAFDIWYGKARRIEPQEINAISDALTKRRKEVTRNELHDLRTRLARLEALLVQTDEEFHRPTLDRLRSSDGGFGGVDSALATPTKRGR